MSAAVETMAYAGERPWHGLGVKIADGVTDVATMITAAGLDWTVSRHELYTMHGEKVDSFAIRRDSDGRIFGVVGDRYRPLQNVDAFRWFDPFVESGLASFHTAGALNDGRKVWILAKLEGRDLRIVGDDVVKRFLLLSNSHDGLTSIRVGYTPIRVVCANTLAMAHRSDASKLIRVRHGKKTNDVLADIRQTMSALDAEFVATADQYRRLTTKYINQRDLAKYVRRVFDIDETTKSRVVEDITRLFETGRGATMPGVKGTLWGAYNAVTEYLAWEAGRTADNRLTALWFGGAAKTNQTALDVALAM